MGQIDQMLDGQFQRLLRSLERKGLQEEGDEVVKDVVECQGQVPNLCLRESGVEVVV